MIIEVNGKKLYSIKFLDEFDVLWFFVLKKMVFSGRSEFQKIDVVDLEFLGRSLVLDGSLQLCEMDEKIYHKALVGPVVFGNEIRRVLILGGGDGMVARELLEMGVESVTVVELDRMVVEVAKKYLRGMEKGALDDERVKVIIGDAFEFVKECKEKYDLVVGDLTDFSYEENKQINRFYTEEFLRIVKKIGRFHVFQTGGLLFWDNKKLEEMKNYWKEVFENVFTYSVFVPSFGGLWAFIAGSDEEMKLKLEKNYVEW